MGSTTGTGGGPPGSRTCASSFGCLQYQFLAFWCLSQLTRVGSEKRQHFTQVLYHLRTNLQYTGQYLGTHQGSVEQKKETTNFWEATGRFFCIDRYPVVSKERNKIGISNNAKRTPTNESILLDFSNRYVSIVGLLTPPLPFFLFDLLMGDLRKDALLATPFYGIREGGALR